jgi:hypothetical protein
VRFQQSSTSVIAAFDAIIRGFRSETRQEFRWWWPKVLATFATVCGFAASSERKPSLEMEFTWPTVFWLMHGLVSDDREEKASFTMVAVAFSDEPLFPFSIHGGCHVGTVKKDW